jgi:transposase-like protein
MVRKLRKELGTEQGTVKRVAEQLGIGVESVRGWVKQAEIDAGDNPGPRLRRPRGSASWSRRSASCAVPMRS